MIVFLDGERFEAALIHMTRSRTPVVRVPTLGMGVRQPTEEIRDRVILLRPEHKMPMIGHEAIRQESDGMFGQRFNQNPFEGIVIARLLKERQACDRPIDGMVNVTGRRRSR